MLADLVVLLAVGLYTNLDEKGTEAMRATVQLLLVVGLYTNLDEKGTEAIRATVQLPGVDSPFSFVFKRGSLLQHLVRRVRRRGRKPCAGSEAGGAYRRI